MGDIACNIKSWRAHGQSRSHYIRGSTVDEASYKPPFWGPVGGATELVAQLWIILIQSPAGPTPSQPFRPTCFYCISNSLSSGIQLEPAAFVRATVPGRMGQRETDDLITDRRDLVRRSLSPVGRSLVPIQQCREQVNRWSCIVLTSMPLSPMQSPAPSGPFQNFNARLHLHSKACEDLHAPASDVRDIAVRFH